MKITPLNTADETVRGASKVLIYGHHGVGKTTQLGKYAERYGKGLVISGESGLASISDHSIPYLPFTTFEATPRSGYSFRQIVDYVMSDDFKAEGYTWIGLDSATELSQRCFSEIEKEFEGSNNGFEKWGAYERKMVAALKWIRDLDLHVVITALATEEQDDNGRVQFWPMLVQKKVQKLIPALYDHVFCLVRKAEEKDGAIHASRLLITDQMAGWQGKTRDPNRRLSAIERTDDVTELLERINMPRDEWLKTQTQSKSGAN